MSLLLKKRQKWARDNEPTKSFETLRYVLTTAPIIVRPDFSPRFTIHTGASTVGPGAMLTQTIDGNERVIAYASRMVSGSEQNYKTPELY